MFEVFAPDANRENPLRPQPYDGAERLKKAHTAIAEKSHSSGGFKSYRLKHQRNSSRRANMVDRDLCRLGHSPGSIPDRVAFHPLKEKITFPCVVVRRGNSECVEFPALDIVLDSVTTEVS